MIVTVTMNPAIDKTVEIEELIRGGLNRIKKVEMDVGGKGINVSKTIKELGGTSIAAGFVAGNAGQIIERGLQSMGIETDFVQVEGETRTNTKVFEQNGALTELNETGPVVPGEKTEELLKRLEQYAGEETLFVLAGSVPAGVSKDIYARITEMVHEKGAKVLVDADGELFRNALKAVPDMMKPNREELAGFLGLKSTAENGGVTEEALLQAAGQMMEQGVQQMAVSMGKDGALILGKGYQVRCPGLKVKIHSTVGAGDAMVAAMAYSWDQKLGKEEMIRICMAASAGAVMTVGTKPPSRELVDFLMTQVQIEGSIL